MSKCALAVNGAPSPFCSLLHVFFRSRRLPGCQVCTIHWIERMFGRARRHDYLDAVAFIEVHVYSAKLPVFRNLDFRHLVLRQGLRPTLILIILPCDAHFQTWPPAFRHSYAAGFPAAGFRRYIWSRRSIHVKGVDRQTIHVVVAAHAHGRGGVRTCGTHQNARHLHYPFRTKSSLVQLF